MKTKIIFLISLAFLLSNQFLQAQSTSANGAIGNLYAANKFLGWDAQNAGGDLPIRTNNVTRMLVQNNTGFLGIGNGFLTPQNRLHQHEPTQTFNYHQFTHLGTGATANDGFRIGIDANAFAEIRQNEFAPIGFWTAGGQRMTIRGQGGVTQGFVGIATAAPRMPLEITGSGVANGQGWTRGLLLTNQAALMWEGPPNTTNNFFMAHSFNRA